MRLGRRYSQLTPDVLERLHYAQVPRLMLEIGRSVEPPMARCHRVFIVVQDHLDGLRCPDVELSFLVLTVGVEARKKAPLG